MQNNQSDYAFRVTIVIPVHNSAATIGKAISATLIQEYPIDKLEIVVVDDGSSDNSAQIIRKFPVKYIFQPNSGPAKARNIGWQSSRGDIICFTDSDCIPEKNWINKIIARYVSDKIAGVGGSYDIADDKSWLAKCIHEEIIQRHLKMPELSTHLASYNFSCRKSVLKEIGGFDESFKAASAEDNELSYRIRKKGYDLIFDKDIKVAHYHKRNLSAYLKQQFRHGYWCMKLYKIHPDMMHGDGYAGLIDYVQPPLFLLCMVSLVMSLFIPKVFVFFSLPLLILLLLLNLPMGLSIVKRKGQKSYLLFIFFAFLRSLVRSIGMAVGIFKFFIFKPFYQKQRSDL